MLFPKITKEQFRGRKAISKSKSFPHFKRWEPLDSDDNFDGKLGDWNGTGRLWEWKCCHCRNHQQLYCIESHRLEEYKQDEQLLGYYIETGNRDEKDYRLILARNGKSFEFKWFYQHEGGLDSTQVCGYVVGSPFPSHHFQMKIEEKVVHQRNHIMFEDLLETTLFEAPEMTSSKHYDLVEDNIIDVRVDVHSQSLRIRMSDNVNNDGRCEYFLRKVDDTLGKSLTAQNESYFVHLNGLQKKFAHKKFVKMLQ